MGLIKIKLTFTGAVPKVARKKLNNVIRKAYDAMGVLWHKTMRPKHFTDAGAREYRYEARTLEYERRKRNRKKGPAPAPLVWSGTSRLASRIRDVRATAKGGFANPKGTVRVVMRTPILNFRRGSRRTTGGQELTRVSRKERLVLAQLLRKEAVAGLNALPDKSTETIK